MKTFHCLFFFQDGKVRVYRFIRNEITIIKKNGLLNFEFCGDTDLWDWWEHVTGITKEDDVDFLFFSDTPRVFKHSFRIHDPQATFWGKKRLESFFKHHYDDPVIDLQWNKDNTPVSIRIKNSPIPKLPEPGKTTMFYVFPPLIIPVQKTDTQGEPGILGDVYNRHAEKLERIKENNKKRLKRK